MSLKLSEKLKGEAAERNAAQALEAMQQSTDVHSLKELAYEIGQQITLREIASIVAHNIRSGSDRAKRDFATAYIDMLARIQRLEGEITEDDAMKLATEEIEQILENQYGERIRIKDGPEREESQGGGVLGEVGEGAPRPQEPGS